MRPPRGILVKIAHRYGAKDSLRIFLVGVCSTPHGPPPRYDADRTAPAISGAVAFRRSDGDLILISAI